MPVDATLVIVLKELEQTLHLGGDAPVCRQQRQVTEHPGGGLIEIPRPHMGIMTKNPALLAGDQHEFGMGLESGHTKDDLYAHLLQFSGNLDVVPFVKPRLQFDHHLHLLSVQCRAGQGIDDVGIVRYPVEVDANGRDLGVDRCLPQHVYELRKCVVGIVQQDVALGHLIQNAPAVHQVPVRQGLQLAIDQVWVVQIGEVHEVPAVVITPPRNDVGLLDHSELAHQKFQQVLGHFSVKEKTHIVAVLSAGNALFHLLEQRLREVVVHVDFRIACHFDGIGPDGIRLKRRKEPGQTHAHHIIQEHEPPPALLFWQHQEPIEVVGKLQQGIARALGHIPLQGDDQIDQAILQLGHAHIGNQDGDQVRTHLLVEVSLHELGLILIETLLGQNVYALL